MVTEETAGLAVDTVGEPIKADATEIVASSGDILLLISSFQTRGAPARVALEGSLGLRAAARQNRDETGTTEAEIDIYFGWHEKILLKEMQAHYERR